MENYADVLESYVIAEEGVFKDIWKDAPIGSKIGAGISATALIAAIGARIYYAIIGRKNDKKAQITTTTSNSQDKKESKNQKYYDNTQQVIAKMKEECPEVLEKEIALRYKELKGLKSTINRISKKIKAPGFSFYTNDIDRMIEDASNGEYVGFLEDYLPAVSPKLFNDYEGQWSSNSDYLVAVASCDIHDWNEITHSNTKNVRDPEDAKEYYDKMNDIFDILTKECSKFKCFTKAVYSGDWDDGPIDIECKPSDDFIKVAKKYGWFE